MPFAVKVIVFLTLGRRNVRLEWAFASKRSKRRGIRLLESLELQLEVNYLICSSLGEKTVAQSGMPSSPRTAL